MVGVRGRAGDRVNHGRLGPKGLFGWQANHAADRLTRPLVRDGGELVETDWDTAMGRIVERSRRSCSTTRRRWLDRLLHQRAAVPGGVLHAGRDREGRARHAAHGRQHPAVHGHGGPALKETFGTDGQPGSYTDVDHCDAIFLLGHNVAETQTVLWMRMLDRPRGPGPAAGRRGRPRAHPGRPREADVHLAVAPGTNLALMNGLLRELIDHGWIDEDVRRRAHARVRRAAPDRRGRTRPSGWPRSAVVPADEIREAAEILGTGDRLLSTVLQGFYQSNQATAAACQVNNLHLLRGMLGRPGCGILQMNGQPTAQNTRETGADGDLPGFRNWDNEAHVRELAELWNVDPMTIPHWAPPTHAMQIFRYAEQGSIELLWISATNPAVSLPELPASGASWRGRAVRGRPGPVPDRDRQLADVVLPAATWGEKTGHVHQRRPHRAPVRARPSTRPARPAATSTSSSTTPAGWTSATATARR